jgi:hypothetical protein
MGKDWRTHFRRPLPVHAAIWLEMGDHPNVLPFSRCGFPASHSLVSCSFCEGLMAIHGCVRAFISVSPVIVCPGDWIVTDVHGETSSLHPFLFDCEYASLPYEEEIL